MTDQIRAALDNLMTMFRDQTFPEQIALSIIRRRQKDGRRPVDEWSLFNFLLVGGIDCRGYRQWQQQANRQVIGGAKALFIIVPVLKKVPSKDGDESPDADVVRRLFGFKAAAVFKVTDTQGAPLPEAADYTPPVLPPLYEVAGKLGLKVRYQPIVGNALGSYSPSEKTIRISEVSSPLTYLHELCHAMDNAIEPILPGRLAEAELVAELGGACLASLYGYTGTESSTYRYLQLYAAEHDPQGVLRCLATVTGRVETIVRRILDLAEPDANTSPEAQQALSA